MNNGNQMAQIFMRMMTAQNPQQMMMAFAGQNPLFAQAMRMAQNAQSQQDLQQIASNIAKEKGIDIGQAQQMFEQMMPKRQ